MYHVIINTQHDLQRNSHTILPPHLLVKSQHHVSDEVNNCVIITIDMIIEVILQSS